MKFWKDFEECQKRGKDGVMRYKYVQIYMSKLETCEEKNQLSVLSCSNYV